MDEHTFQTPHVSSHEPASAPPSPNGSHPLGYGELLGEMAADAKLATRAIEDLNMRVQAVQAMAAILVGLTVLLLALEAREIRKLGR